MRASIRSAGTNGLGARRLPRCYRGNRKIGPGPAYREGPSPTAVVLELPATEIIFLLDANLIDAKGFLTVRACVHDQF